MIVQGTDSHTQVGAGRARLLAWLHRVTLLFVTINLVIYNGPLDNLNITVGILLRYFHSCGSRFTSTPCTISKFVFHSGQYIKISGLH